MNNPHLHNYHYIDTLNNLRQDILVWLKTVHQHEHTGYYRYSYKGSLHYPSAQSGLGMSCFALRTYYTLGALDAIEPNDLQAWTNYIKSFQTHKGVCDGYFEDTELLRVVDKKMGRFRRDMGVRRAETRQACGTLLSVGAKPRYPVIADLPQTSEQLIDYIYALPWLDNPWHAGSHTSHLAFFLKLNADVFGYTDKFAELMPLILIELDRLQDPDTGSWFGGTPSMPQIINGAMKVLTIYELLQRPFAYPEKLIDTCLNAKNDSNACGNVDITLVLHHCQKWTTYRQNEIRAFAEERLQSIMSFRKPDGAFSFLPDTTGKYYYKVEISQGLVESDLHGTSLFTWTIAMLAEILGIADTLGWHVPII
ncbi:MAG: hypothetical protein B6242_09985 [Anaerolineaceae bacterium 4572_78]|nr:MAG: hypothetical protein B6242_09985 [Anaerolineaceae bacterium 4572_78]